MNDAILWRVVWKEYRVQRGLWVSMVVLTFLALVLPLVYTAIRAEALSSYVLFAIALGAPAVYALGCGATLFATEHETGTFEFQRALPMSAGKLFAGKVGFAAASMVVLTGVLWLLAVALSWGQFPEAHKHLELWAGGLVAGLELMAWGVFFSLLLRQPLWAAVFAVAAASVGVHLVIPALVRVEYSQLGLNHYLAILPFRAVFALLLLAIDVWLVKRWQADSTFAPIHKGRRLELPAASRTWMIAPAVRLRAVGWLVWHQWRQTRAIILTVACLFFSVVLYGTMWDFSRGGFRAPVGELFFLLIPLAGLFGACAFLYDQSGRQFRFFAEQGIGPRWLWLSRQVVWLAALLVLMLFVAAIEAVHFMLAAWSAATRQFHGSDALSTSAAAIGLAIVVFCAGQLSSVYLRSGVLAIFFGTISAVVLCAWSGLMVTIGASLLWSVAPIPLVLSWASWLRAPDWILERTSWRARAKAVASLAVPATALLVVVALYRIYEIPLTDPGFSLSEVTRPITDQERETAQRYYDAWTKITRLKEEPPEQPTEAVGEKAVTNGDSHRGASDSPPPAASDLYPMTPEKVEWVRANEAVIAQVIATSRRPSCAFFDPAHNRFAVSNPDFTGDLARLLIAAARQGQAEGDLDAGWEAYAAVLRLARHLRYRAGWFEHDYRAQGIETMVYETLPYWAGDRRQTAERLRRALSDVQKINQDLPPRDSAIRHDYLLSRRILDCDPELIDAPEFKSADLEKVYLVLKLVPWEVARARRLLGVFVRSELDRVQFVRRALKEGLPWHGIFVGPDAQTDRWERTTPLFRLLPLASRGRGVDLFQQEFHLATIRRAAQVDLALQAWRCEHGQLPESLDALAADFLDSVPLDPYTGAAFRYFPDGLPDDLVWQKRYEPQDRIVKAGQPFLWSAGVRVMLRSDGAGARKYYVHRENSVGFHHPDSEHEVWQLGWPFPLRYDSARQESEK